MQRYRTIRTEDEKEYLKPLGKKICEWVGECETMFPRDYIFCTDFSNNKKNICITRSEIKKLVDND